MGGTLVAVGTDAYNSVLDIYAYTKMTGGVARLDELRASLGNRFRSNGSRRNEAADQESTDS
ncbi:MAG: hypothetical protein AB2551_07980 [Candidatus Thiodiazotropha sp.]